MKRIDWTGVDLTRPAKDIARELGIGTSAIYRRRGELGLKVPHESSGPRPMCGGAQPGAGRKKGGHNSKYAEPGTGIYSMVPKSVADKLREYAASQNITMSKAICLILTEAINAGKA